MRHLFNCGTSMPHGAASVPAARATAAPSRLLVGLIAALAVILLLPLSATAAPVGGDGISAQSTPLVLADSYWGPVSYDWYLSLQDFLEAGQVFTAVNGTLDSASFSLSKYGNPPDMMYARLWALSGGIPTGVPLATSIGVPASSLGEDTAEIRFYFDNTYHLQAGAKYAITLYYPAGDFNNEVQLGVRDFNEDPDDAVWFWTAAGPWGRSGVEDVLFRVWETPPPPPLNDNFEFAQPIFGGTGSTAGSNASATKQVRRAADRIECGRCVGLVRLDTIAVAARDV